MGKKVERDILEMEAMHAKNENDWFWLHWLEL